MGAVSRFAEKYRGHLTRLALEECLGWPVRNLPSLPGMWVRAVLWKRLFKRLQGFPLIYPGVYCTHAYGICAGRDLSINTGALIDGRGGVTIGDNVLIGPYSVITSSTHDHRDPRVAVTTLDHIMQPVSIGDDVWIGAQCFIRGGVRIGRGVVVAAGAVVVTSVPDYAIVAGVPARSIGSRMPSATVEPV